MRFALRQLARFALLMLAVSFVTFLLVSISPIDPVQANTGQAAMLSMSAEKRAELAARWSVGVPVWERYATWLSGAVHGDLGESLRFNAPVVQVVAERLSASAALLASAWVVSGALGLALGVVAGARRDSPVDRIVRGWCYLLSATPTFWLALIALMVLAVYLGWFPIGFSVPIGRSAATVTLAERLRHVARPARVLSGTGVANNARHTRAKTIDVMASDYARFARARGEGAWTVVRRHGLRNLVLPALTLQFTSISEIVGGSVLVEQVFSYPGLGQAAVTAGLGGDAPLLVGIALATAALVFAGNLAANLLYGVIDPRMRQGRSARRGGGLERGRGDGPQASRAVDGPGAAADAPSPAVDALGAAPAPAGAGDALARAPAPASVSTGCPAVVPSAAPAGSADRPAPAVPVGPSGAAGVSVAAAAPARTACDGGVTVFHAPHASGRGGSRRRMLAGALLAAAVICAVVVAGALLAPRATATDFTAVNLSPSPVHPFGTDWMGRDMLARTLSGLATSVLVGLASAAVSSVIALALACAAALGGPRVDAAVEWVIDLVMGIPHIVLLILVSYALGRGALGVCAGVALTHWPSLTRVLRAEILQLRERPFVACSRALGVSPVRLALTHMVPSVLPQYLIGLVLLFPHAILHEASITFLGFGLPPEQPAIGVILSESMSYLTSGAWWLAVFPGAALLAVVLMFDRVGATLRRLLSAEGVQS